MSWRTVLLSEIADVAAGNSAPQNETLFIDGVHNFYRTSDVGRIRNGVIHEAFDKLNSEGVRGLKLHAKGTILFPKSGASTFLNHRVMLEKEGYVSSHLATIKAKSGVADDKFLLYFLTTVDAKNLVQDSNYPSLKTSVIGSIPILLPSLEIQQKIVEKLDAIFAEIDKATAAAKANIKNAESLFQSYLDEVFEHGGEGWIEKSIEDITLKTKNISPEKKPNEKFIYVDVSSVSNKTFEIVNTQIIFGKDAPSRAKKHILKNDIIFATVRPTLMRIAVVPDFLDNQVASTGYVVLRANEENYSKFIYFFLFSKVFMSAMSKLQKGASYPAVTENDVKLQRLKVPDLSEQIALSNKLEVLMEQTSSMSKNYQSKIIEFSNFKKSILKHAFNGELVKE